MEIGGPLRVQGKVDNQRYMKVENAAPGSFQGRSKTAETKAENRQISFSLVPEVALAAFFAGPFTPFGPICELSGTKKARLTGLPRRTISGAA